MRGPAAKAYDPSCIPPTDRLPPLPSPGPVPAATTEIAADTLAPILSDLFKPFHLVFNNSRHPHADQSGQSSTSWPTTHHCEFASASARDKRPWTHLPLSSPYLASSSQATRVAQCARAGSLRKVSLKPSVRTTALLALSRPRHCCSSADLCAPPTRLRLSSVLLLALRRGWSLPPSTGRLLSFDGSSGDS